MKIIITTLLLLLYALPALSDYLYCSVPSDVHVYHFDVGIHTVDDFTNGGSSNQGFNYLDITNFVKIGSSIERPGYIRYRVMDVSFLDENIPYRITIIAAKEELDFMDAPAVRRMVYGYTGISEPLFTHQLTTPKELEIKM